MVLLAGDEVSCNAETGPKKGFFAPTPNDGATGTDDGAGDGVLRIEWDNSASKLKPKTVSFKVVPVADAAKTALADHDPEGEGDFVDEGFEAVRAGKKEKTSRFGGVKAMGGGAGVSMRGLRSGMGRRASVIAGSMDSMSAMGRLRSSATGGGAGVAEAGELGSLDEAA